MNGEVKPLERAFQLAKTGKYLSVEEIRKRLKVEGFSTDQIIGGALFKQLRQLIETSRKSDPEA